MVLDFSEATLRVLEGEELKAGLNETTKVRFEYDKAQRRQGDRLTMGN